MAKIAKRVLERLERKARDSMHWLTSPGRENRYIIVRKEGDGGKYIGYILKPIKDGLIEFKDLATDASEELGIDAAAKKVAQLQADGYAFITR